MTVLVVGGAGYIGSHMVKMLVESGMATIVIDNLSTGYPDAVKGVPLYTFCISETEKLKKIISEHKVKSVIHFASYSLVGESVTDPDKYYLNNIDNTLSLLNTLSAMGVENFVFSSSAAVYGAPQYTPIDEDHPLNPINPYGETKQQVEESLEAFYLDHNISSVSLRYFNAAGAASDGSLGERHEPETHLIPNVLQVASGRKAMLEVYGSDYETPDGTCIRDYIHVEDLCQAHLKALTYLSNTPGCHRFNLGNGNGFSVKEVIHTARQVTGKDIQTVYTDRREGDPSVLVANASKAKALLNWAPEYNSIETIIEHAWTWEKKSVEGKRQ